MRRISDTILTQAVTTKCLVILCWVLATSTAYSDSDSAIAKEHKTTIETILDGEDFNQTRTQSGWRLKNIKEDKDAFPDWIIRLVEYIETLNWDWSWDSDTERKKRDSSFVGSLAMLLELLLWGLGIALIIYMVYKLNKPMQQWVEELRKPKHGPLPSHIAGMEITPESLPDDIISDAYNYWNDQQPRQAIGLLYRASLSRLVHHYSCRLASSYTEQECLQSIGALNIHNLSEFMSELTLQWQQLAYGHQQIEQAIFSTLCQQWQHIFEEHAHER